MIFILGEEVDNFPYMSTKIYCRTSFFSFFDSRLTYVRLMTYSPFYIPEQKGINLALEQNSTLQFADRGRPTLPKLWRHLPGGDE